MVFTASGMPEAPSCFVPAAAADVLRLSGPACVAFDTKKMGFASQRSRRPPGSLSGRISLKFPSESPEAVLRN